MAPRNESCGCVPMWGWSIFPSAPRSLSTGNFSLEAVEISSERLSNGHPMCTGPVDQPRCEPLKPGPGEVRETMAKSSGHGR